MNFPELLARRRSIRDYQERAVSPEVVSEILKDTCLAPSSGNGQPWQFIVVHNKEWIRRFSEESKKNFVAAIEKDPRSPLKKYEANLRSKEFNVFYNVPCLVYIGAERSSVSATGLLPGGLLFHVCRRGARPGNLLDQPGNRNPEPRDSKGYRHVRRFPDCCPYDLRLSKSRAGAAHPQ